jgi:3-hydroxyisobutyrate dehydrogenase
MKDLSYALEMAEASGLDMKAAKLTMERLKQAEAAGYGDQYHPVVLKVIDPQ